MNLCRWKLSFFALICIACLIGCHSPNTPDTSQNSSPFSSETKFLEYKEEGIKAIKENRLTDDINLILEAIVIQDIPELHNILDNAYLERAEYFFSVGEREKTLSDLEKIKSKRALILHCSTS